MGKRIDLLIIDPQKDFCDPSGGALYVKDAEKDIFRIAKMISRIGNKLNNIHVSLDSHHLFDVAHPIYWKDSSGKNPDPYIQISHDDVKNGTWRTSLPSLQQRGLEYVKKLEENGRYPLTIWPPHCIIGSEGHALMPDLYNVLIDWEEGLKIVDKVTKGSNPHTEHYSIIKADVIDPTDPSTQLNTRLIQTLEECDMIIVCGEALSHCVANTLRDIIKEFSDQSYAKKVVIMEDGCSSVEGFTDLGSAFMQEMIDLGVEINNTQNILS